MYVKNFSLKTIFGLSLSMAGSSLIQTIGWFFGMLMIARLGISELAASGLINAAQIFDFVIFLVLFQATGVMTARFYGERNTHALHILLKNTLILACLLGIVFGLILYWTPYVWVWTHQNAVLTSINESYFHPLAYSGIPFLLMTNLQQFFYGIGAQRWVIIYSIASTLAFLLCAYGLVFGEWGLPCLGVGGVAWACVAQSIIGASALWIHLYFLGPNFGVKNALVDAPSHFSKRTWFQIGWPIAVQQGGELLIFAVCTVFAGWLGVVALSSFQITLEIMLLILVPLFSVGEATGILVSQCVGRRAWSDLRRVVHWCFWINVIAVCLFGGVLVSIPDVFTKWYVHITQPEALAIIALARPLFFWGALSLLLDTLRNVYTGALRGLYDTRFALWIGIVSLWVVALPLSYWMAFPAHLGVVGIRIATLIGFVLMNIFLAWRWHSKARSLPDA